MFRRSDRGGKTSKGEVPPPSLTGVSTLSATGQRWRAVWAREAEFETHHRPRDWEKAPSLSNRRGAGAGACGDISGRSNLGSMILYRSGWAHQKVPQGGIFDLNMYVTFDCAGIAAF